MLGEGLEPPEQPFLISRYRSEDSSCGWCVPRARGGLIGELGLIVERRRGRAHGSPTTDRNPFVLNLEVSERPRTLDNRPLAGSLRADIQIGARILAFLLLRIRRSRSEGATRRRHILQALYSALLDCRVVQICSVRVKVFEESLAIQQSHWLNQKVVCVVLDEKRSNQPGGKRLKWPCRPVGL